MESFANAPEQIREVVNTYGFWLEDVGDSPWRINETTGKKEKGSFYIPNEFVIKIDERKDNDNYVSTFRHEYGHYIDDVIGNCTENMEYSKAFHSDKKIFDNAIESGCINLEKAFQDLSENDIAFESSYISDIFSALTMNDTKVKEFYGNKYSYHEWGDYMLPLQHMKSETFANLFAIYTENNSDVIAFTEKWFPNLTHEFKTSMDRAVLGSYIEREEVRL